MLEIRHLETLTAIRDGGSLQEAAERLHLTQSALSHQLRDLETRLGTPLLNRRTRPARLTTAGLRVLALADEVLPRMRATEQELQRLAAGRSGRLHLAIDCHSCFQWLMPALDAFRAQWPDVALDLSAAFSFAPLPALVRGDLDLVITSDPQPLDAVDYPPLFKYELVLAVSESIPGRQQVRHAGPAGGPDADHLPGGQAAPGRLHRVPGPGRRGAGRDTQGRTHPHHRAAGRQQPRRGGAAELGADGIHEPGLAAAVPAGAAGVWRTLYATVRSEDTDASYIDEFLTITRDVCFKTLSGIKSAK